MNSVEIFERQLFYNTRNTGMDAIEPFVTMNLTIGRYEVGHLRWEKSSALWLTVARRTKTVRNNASMKIGPRLR